LGVHEPLGPRTPGTLLRIRAAVEADPPPSFGFRTDRPLELPPNWLTYLIHSVVALSLFSVLAAFLGYMAGFLTTGLSPPARRKARWALGLATGAAFFFALMAAGSWVRQSHENSGIAASYLPLLIPALALILLYYLARTRTRGEHGLSDPDVP
jgi:hypothetical protein